MKTKLICSALFGATICGSAFAISVDDRQAFCEQHPDKYVWVEKTQACIPINTCESGIEDIKKAYCVTSPTLDEDLLEKYISNVLKTSVKQKSVPYDPTMSDFVQYGNKYMGYKTNDGGYIVFEYKDNPNVYTDLEQRFLNPVCWAYGAIGGAVADIGNTGSDNNFYYECSSLDMNSTKCDDIVSYNNNKNVDILFCVGKLKNKDMFENQPSFVPKIESKMLNSCIIQCDVLSRA